MIFNNCTIIGKAGRLYQRVVALQTPKDGVSVRYRADRMRGLAIER